MSYDIYLEVDTGGEEPVEVWWRNHTSNTASMWVAAGCDLALYHGKTATELAEAIEVAVANMKAEPGRYREYNSPNGWGTYSTTLLFLSEIHKACVENPKTTVRVSR